MGVGRWGGSAEAVEILVLHAFSLDSLETEDIVLRLGRMKSESPGLEMDYRGLMSPTTGGVSTGATGGAR